MARELTKQQLIERSLIKKYRKELWNPFIACVQRYRLVLDGDRIAVVLDGSLAAQLAAKLLQQLQRVSDTDFALTYVAYPQPLPAESAALLQLPLQTVKEADAPTESALLSLTGCNKLAYGTCRTEVVAATLAAMFYHGRAEGVLPKAPLAEGEGERLLPLYGISQDAVAAWARYNGLHGVTAAKTPELAAAAAIVEALKKTNPDVERNVLQSLHAVCRDTLPGYVQNGEHHSFLEHFNAVAQQDKK